jgi:hypothetical protein
MPLVDLSGPLDLGRMPRGLEEGMAGHELGEGRRDVLAERRLVLLHRQDIIHMPLDQRRADIAGVNPASPVRTLPRISRTPNRSWAALCSLVLASSRSWDRTALTFGA